LVELQAADREASSAAARRQEADRALALLGDEQQVVDIPAMERELVLVDGSIEELKRQFGELQTRRSLLANNIGNERQRQQSQAALRQKIDQGIDQQEVDRLQGVAARLRESYDRGVVENSRRAGRAERRQKIESIRGRRNDSFELGLTLRQSAKRSVDLLREAVKGFEGWSVSDDLRLMCWHDERQRLVPIGEHSPGQRIKHAIRLMLPSYRVAEGEVPVVVVPQQIIEQLDYAGMEMLVELAKQHQMCIAGGRCSSRAGDPKELSVQVLN
jgi:hypothetical protein